MRELVGAVREVYAAAWVPLLAGSIAAARGRADDAVEILVDGARRQRGRTEIWGAALLLAECCRCLARRGRGDDAQEPRDQLAVLVSWSVPARALLAWVDGVLEPERSRQ